MKTEASLKRERLAITAAALVSVAGIALASYALVSNASRTLTSTTTIAETVTSTATINQTLTSTTTVSQTVTAALNYLQVGCLQNSAVSNAERSDYPILTVSGGRTALLCVRVYHFNSTSAINFNFTKSLEIEAVEYPSNGQPIGFSGAANFTITPSQPEITLSGPGNENEGALIAWAISPKPGASGSYELDFSAPLLQGGGTPECGSYGELAAGNGKPSYLIQGFQGCIISTNIGSATTIGPNQTRWPVTFGLITRDVTLNNGETYFVLSAFSNARGL